MSKDNFTILKNWVDELEQRGMCANWGYYENGFYYDFSIMYDWRLEKFSPDKILQITKEQFLYVQYVNFRIF